MTERLARWEQEDHGDYDLDRLTKALRERLYSDAGKEVLNMNATERDCQIVETLARELMGWIVAGWRCHSSLIKQPVVFIRADRTYVYDWNPLTDWRAVGEVLEKMQSHVSQRVWNRFVDGVKEALGGYSSITLILLDLKPKIIAEAAFEALEMKRTCR